MSTLHPGEHADYSDGPYIKLRVFSEADWVDNRYPWSIDAVDADGNYSERVQSFATYDEAVAALADFWNEMKDVGVVVCDNCGRPNPPIITGTGRFCDDACMDAYDLH